MNEFLTIETNKKSQYVMNTNIIMNIKIMILYDTNNHFCSKTLCFNLKFVLLLLFVS